MSPVLNLTNSLNYQDRGLCAEHSEEGRLHFLSRLSVSIGFVSSEAAARVGDI